MVAGIWKNEELLREAVTGSKTVKEVLLKLGVPPHNGNYRLIKIKSALYGITLPDGRINSPTIMSLTKIDNDAWFVKGVERNNLASKRRLLSLGTKNECSACGCPPEWNGLPLTLQLDHIDGDSLNNLKKNLRLLCPNCHTQTKTYANGLRTKKYSHCGDCGAKKSKAAKSCRKCHIDSGRNIANLERAIRHHIEWPDLESLAKLLRDCGSYRQLGQQLGVSDNAIRKRLLSIGIEPKEFAMRSKNSSRDLAA